MSFGPLIRRLVYAHRLELIRTRVTLRKKRTRYAHQDDRFTSPNTTYEFEFRMQTVIQAEASQCNSRSKYHNPENRPTAQCKREKLKAA